MISTRHSSVALVAFVALIACVHTQAQILPPIVPTVAVFGVNYALSATPTTYSYVAGALPPTLTVSGSSSTSVTFSLNIVNDVTIGSSPSFGQSGFPAGFSAIQPTFLSAALGFSVLISSTTVTNFQFSLTFPALNALQLALYSKGNIGVLYYDVQAQTYVRIPASSLVLDGNNQLKLNWNRPGYFYVLNVNTAPIVKAIDAGTQQFLIATNSSQSFSLSYNGKVAVTIGNVNANAGTISVGISANAAAQSTPAVLGAGKKLISNVFTFSYSEGSSQLQSATLNFNLTASTVASSEYNLANLAWHKWFPATNSWVAQGGSLSFSASGDAMISYQTTGFSDWSVQSVTLSSANAAAMALSPLLLAALAFITNKLAML